MNNKPQRQDSLTDQLKDLAVIANKEGMYDAADYINSILNKRYEWQKGLEADE